MRLGRLADVRLDSTSLLCRQGRLMGGVGVLVLSLALTGAPVLWYYVDAPWFVWGVCALLAVVIVPMLLGDLRARFRPTNWLLWASPDGIWINFRSYQDEAPDETPAAVYLDYREIAAAREFVETYTTPSSPGNSTYWKVRSLELRLHEQATSELAAAISASRRRPQPQRVHLGFMRVTSRPTWFPVSVPEPGTIRIAWRGGQMGWAAPSLKRVLRELAQYVPVEESRRLDRDHWRSLSPDELDDQVLALVQAGDRMAAAQLLVRGRGYSTTEAHQFVSELHAKM